MSAGTSDPAGYFEVASCGDIILKVSTGGETVELKVSSHVLCTTSPVFRAMLGSGSQFKEASELRTCSVENPYELSLEDDYPHALTVTLLALHCRSEVVPVDLTFRNLVELAIVCDKYDCRGGVLPWVDTWTAPWRFRVLESGYEEWLFVAWVFGIEAGFDELSKKVTLESYIDSTSGKLRSVGGAELEALTIPEAVLDSITLERARTIARMIRERDDILPRYTAAWGKGTLCKGEPPLEECDASILGSIMKSFESSRPATEDQGMSIFGLRDEISRLRLNFLPKLSCYEYHNFPSRYLKCHAAPGATKCSCGGNLAVRGSHSETCNPVRAISGIVSSVRGVSLKASKRIPKKGSRWKVVNTRRGREPAADAPEALSPKGRVLRGRVIKLADSQP